MNDAARHALDAEPVPVKDGMVGEAGIHHDGKAWRTHWLVGTEKQTFGPAYASAKEAGAASRHLNGRVNDATAR